MWVRNVATRWSQRCQGNSLHECCVQGLSLPAPAHDILIPHLPVQGFTDSACLDPTRQHYGICQVISPLHHHLAGSLPLVINIHVEQEAIDMRLFNGVPVVFCVAFIFRAVSIRLMLMLRSRSHAERTEFHSTRHDDDVERVRLGKCLQIF